MPPFSEFSPQESTTECVQMTLDEYEAIRLLDLENLQQEQAAASGPQVAHLPAPAHRGKGSQPQGVLPQRKNPRRLTQEKWAQPLRTHTPASPKRAVKCRVIRPVSPQMI